MLLKLAAQTDVMCFSHLMEIVRLSGMLAVQNGGQERTDTDVLSALKTVREALDAAEQGFSKPSTATFGFTGGVSGRNR